ncbi:MAG: prepilin-type N-terminal cleavage/methylation domain-containing protein [bacterium]
MLKNYPQGISLVELLISIGILGLIAAITIPQIRTSILNFTLSNAAKEIITDLRYVQQRTVSEQNFYYAQFIEQENKYLLIKESTGEILKEKILPSEIIISISGNLTENENKAKFNYFGAAIATGTITLVNTYANTILTIEIKPSGYVNYSSQF